VRIGCKCSAAGTWDLAVVPSDLTCGSRRMSGASGEQAKLRGGQAQIVGHKMTGRRAGADLERAVEDWRLFPTSRRLLEDHTLLGHS